MKYLHLVVLFSSALLLFHIPSNGQISIKFRGSSGWCVGDRYDQFFIATGLETISGQVMSIDTVTPMRTMSTGIQFRLKTTREEINVHLGPSWYILNQDISLSVNDKNIDVRGYRAVIDGNTIFMASSVVRKDKIIMLRDEEGVPYWCAWRPRFR